MYEIINTTTGRVCGHTDRMAEAVELVADLYACFPDGNTYVIRETHAHVCAGGCY